MTQKKQHTKKTYTTITFFTKGDACCMLLFFIARRIHVHTAFNHPSYIIYIRDKHINHNNIITSLFLLDVVSIVDLLTFDPCIYRYYESDNNTLFAINNPGEY